MAKSFRIIAFLSLFLLAGFVGRVCVPHLEFMQALAQDRKLSDSPQDRTNSGKASKNGKTVPQGTSAAERIIQMQSTIETDKKKLNDLKRELAELQQEFKRDTAKLTELKGRIAEKKKAIENAQEKGDSSDEDKLKIDIDSLDKEYENTNKESNLVFQAEKTVRQQIKTLNEKIERNVQTLNRLRGTEAPAEKPKPATSPAPAKQTEKASAPVRQLLPTAKAVTSQAAPSAREAKPAAEPIATAQQIEAGKEAEVKKQEAEEAAVAIVETVERKESLKKEIGLVEKMLSTYREAQETLEKRLLDLEDDLTRKIAAGEAKKELQKIRKEIVETQNKIKEIQKDIRNRSTRLIVLNKELDTIQEEQILATKEADKKRKEAEGARKKIVWLESPLHPSNILRWAVVRGPKLITILIALVLVLLAVRVTSKRLAKMVVRHGVGTKEEREKRAHTLGSTFRGALSAAIIIGGTLLLLEEAGLDIKTLLGGAAVIGLAIAFGAQNLMRDYFSGFMILVEGQYELNDVIKIGDVSGTVERMSMRMTTLRDLKGSAHFIPNGQITRVTNMTHKWSQVMFEIGVTYKADVDRVMGMLKEIAGELKEDEEYRSAIIAEPVMLGVDLFSESGIVIKMLMRTKPGMQWSVKREMLRRIKNRFDAEGIEIPLPHRIVYQRLEKNET
ncbi:MAG: mechanosensitive ion channel [Deltaproteobacteria bacterium]|nr:mechanosensitive ion channel [Deltaproteobacteria bacterium]